MAKRPRPAIHRKIRQNRFSMFLATLVVLVLLVVVTIGSNSMRGKLNEYRERESYLQEQIAVEHERARDIENQEKYTHTMRYVEEAARKWLGLIYPDEQIFRRK